MGLLGKLFPILPGGVWYAAYNAFKTYNLYITTSRDRDINSAAKYIFSQQKRENKQISLPLDTLVAIPETLYDILILSIYLEDDTHFSLSLYSNTMRTLKGFCSQYCAHEISNSWRSDFTLRKFNESRHDYRPRREYIDYITEHFVLAFDNDNEYLGGLNRISIVEVFEYVTNEAMDGRQLASMAEEMFCHVYEGDYMLATGLFMSISSCNELAEKQAMTGFFALISKDWKTAFNNLSTSITTIKTLGEIK